jgi:hypothetical protein
VVREFVAHLRTRLPCNLQTQILTLKYVREYHLKEVSGCCRQSPTLFCLSSHPPLVPILFTSVSFITSELFFHQRQLQGQLAGDSPCPYILIPCDTPLHNSVVHAIKPLSPKNNHFAREIKTISHPPTLPLSLVPRPEKIDKGALFFSNLPELTEKTLDLRAVTWPDKEILECVLFERNKVWRSPVISLRPDKFHALICFRSGV